MGTVRSNVNKNPESVEFYVASAIRLKSRCHFCLVNQLGSCPLQRKPSSIMKENRPNSSHAHDRTHISISQFFQSSVRSGPAELVRRQRISPDAQWRKKASIPKPAWHGRPRFAACGTEDRHERSRAELGARSSDAGPKIEGRRQTPGPCSGNRATDEAVRISGPRRILRAMALDTGRTTGIFDFMFGPPLHIPRDFRQCRSRLRMPAEDRKGTWSGDHGRGDGPPPRHTEGDRDDSPAATRPRIRQVQAEVFRIGTRPGDQSKIDLLWIAFHVILHVNPTAKRVPLARPMPDRRGRNFGDERVAGSVTVQVTVGGPPPAHACGCARCRREKSRARGLPAETAPSDDLRSERHAPRRWGRHRTHRDLVAPVE